MNIRIKWLRDQLKSMKLDGMIVSNPINVRYLTGLEEEGIFIDQAFCKHFHSRDGYALHHSGGSRGRGLTT